ncbi:MAG: c-type cytochrome [Rubrivivax sp.]|nr:c-type cytochrome [Rubrivivax sp.]
MLAPQVAQAQASSPAAQTPATRRAACDACHGADGISRQGGVPSLAGQPRLFLENRLVLIREGLVDVPTMKGLLEGVDDAELVALARHYAALPPPPPAVPRDAARAGRGERLAERMLCGSCHLSDQRGRDQIPRLAGQREDYLLATMRQFATGQARGRDTTMAEAVRGLADADLADLAHYLATLAGAP